MRSLGQEIVIAIIACGLLQSCCHATTLPRANSTELYEDSARNPIKNREIGAPNATAADSSVAQGALSSTVNTTDQQRSNSFIDTESQTAAAPFSLLDQPQLEEMEPEESERKPFKKKKKKKRKKKRKGGVKKKKRKKKKKQKQPKPQHIVGQPAQVIFAAAEHPHYHEHEHYVPPTLPTVRPTKKPKRRKIKYIIKSHNPLKKRKKDYFKHLFYVVLPFIKFIAFFTVLNPFTLGVFLFSLISPVVFGGLGFLGLSFLIKPALNLLFDVKRRVGIINRRKWRDKRKRERWQHGQRPITIHKHYYQYRPAPSKWHRQARHNPILPHVRAKLKHGPSSLVPDFVRYEKINYNRA